MKTPMTLATLCLAVCLVAGATSAQGCPYTTTFTSYGSACSHVSVQLPSLTAPFPPSSDCTETVLWDVPVACCNVLLLDRWLVVGFAPAALPLPHGGCTLLASANVIIGLPAIEGGLVIPLQLPPNPALVGASIYLQGIDRRFVTIGGTIHIETSNGLQLTFL